MKRKAFTVRAASVLLCCLSSMAASGALLSYELLGDIPLEHQPRRIEFSSSGRHVLVTNDTGPGGHCLAAYTESDSRALHVKRIPGGATPAWNSNDTLYVPLTRGISFCLPAYDAVAAAEQRLAADSTDVGTLDRLAVAAWTYCKNSSFTMISGSGANTPKELSELTIDAFGPKPRDMSREAERLAEKTLDAIDAASRVYFVDESGRRPSSTPDVPRSLPRLFLVQGERKREVTAPGMEGVKSYSYDRIAKRVLAVRAADVFVYDDATGERRGFFPSFDLDTRTEMTYFLVPGEDYLVVRLGKLDAKGYGYEAEWLELWTLDGRSVGIIPTGADKGVTMGSMAISRYLLAVRLSMPDSSMVLRVFRAVESP